MLVGDEDVTNARERDARHHELPGDTVTTIDHVRGVVRDNHLRRRRTRLARPWTSSRSEEYEPGGTTLRNDRLGTHRRCTSDRCRQKSSTGGGGQFAAILSAVAAEASLT